MSYNNARHKKYEETLHNVLSPLHGVNVGRVHHTKKRDLYENNYSYIHCFN